MDETRAERPPKPIVIVSLAGRQSLADTLVQRNYSCRLPDFCVSVCLYNDNEFVVGHWQLEDESRVQGGRKLVERDLPSR